MSSILTPPRSPSRLIWRSTGLLHWNGRASGGTWRVLQAKECRKSLLERRLAEASKLWKDFWTTAKKVCQPEDLGNVTYCLASIPSGCSTGSPRRANHTECLHMRTWYWQSAITFSSWLRDCFKFLKITTSYYLSLRISSPHIDSYSVSTGLKNARKSNSYWPGVWTRGVGGMHGCCINSTDITTNPFLWDEYSDATAIFYSTL